MITLFNISGAMIYLDAEGGTIGYEDVFTKLEMCRRHYADVGLGADYVERSCADAAAGVPRSRL